MNSQFWSGKVLLARNWGSDLFMKFWGFSRVASPAPLQGIMSLGRDFFSMVTTGLSEASCMPAKWSYSLPKAHPSGPLQCSGWGHRCTPLTASFRCGEHEPNFLSSVESHVVGDVGCLGCLFSQFLTLSSLRMDCLQTCARRTREGSKARCCPLL